MAGRDGRTSPGPLRLAAIITILLLAAIAFDPTPLLRGPAPYPPEWRWHLREGSPGAGGLALAILSAAGVLALVAATGLPAARRAPRRARAIVLGLATLLGLALQWSLLETAGETGAAALLVERTTSPVFTSYYTVAASPGARDVASLLDRYAGMLPALPLHAATHPPGPVLFYRALLSVAEGATPLVAPLLLLLLAAATCWPVAAIARRIGCSDAAAARAGALWVLVPGLVLMSPEMDQLLALPVAGSALLLLTALSRRRTDRRAVVLAALAGAAAGIASLISYGAAAFIACGWLAAAAFAVEPRKDGPRLWPLPAIAAAFALGVHLLPAIWGYDPLAAFTTAMRLHRESFTSPRSYPAWLVFDLWDFAVFLGFPLAALAVAGTVRAARRLRDRTLGADPAARFQLASIAGLLALDLSGSVRGEVGRIWIPLMPFILIAAMALPPRPRAGDAPPSRKRRGDAARSGTSLTAPAALEAGPSLREALLVGALLAACVLVLGIRWDVP